MADDLLPATGSSFTDYQPPPATYGFDLPSHVLGGGSQFTYNWATGDLMPASQFYTQAMSPWLPSLYGVGGDLFSPGPSPSAMPADGASPSLAVDGVHPVQTATPAQIAAARQRLRDGLNGFQVEDFNGQPGELYYNGQKVGSSSDSRALINALQAVEASASAPGADASAGDEPGALKSAIDQVWGVVKGINLPPEVKSVLGALAVGGIGIGIAQAMAPGDREINLPPVPGPGPEQQAAQRAFGNVLTTGGATTGVPAGVAGLATPNLTAPFAATGQQNLEEVFRSGLAGQSLLTQLAAMQAARELGISTEQAPYEAALRNLSMAQVPSFLTPPNAGPGALQMVQGPDGAYSLAPAVAGLTQPPRIDDPIRAAFASEIARAVSGGTASPLLERMEREEEEQLRNRLHAQLGGGYEVSTPGIEALQRMRESQAIRREGNRQQTYSTLGPQEFSRRGAEYQVPLTAASSLTNIDLSNRGFTSRERQTGLAERLGLLNLGRTPTPQIATTLSQNVPISPLLGLDSAERARQRQYELNTQAALESFRSDTQSDQALANAIAGLFGGAAGAAFRQPQEVVVRRA